LYFLSVIKIPRVVQPSDPLKEMTNSALSLDEHSQVLFVLYGGSFELPYSLERRLRSAYLRNDAIVVRQFLGWFLKDMAVHPALLSKLH